MFLFTESIDENLVIHIKEEPLDAIHPKEVPVDSNVTNHIEEQKNGRSYSPEYPISDKPMVNNKHSKQNNKKDVKTWTHNSGLRSLVVKEVRKPGKSKNSIITYLNYAKGFKVHLSEVKLVVKWSYGCNFALMKSFWK